MESEAVNKHFADMLPMVRNPVAEYHFANISRLLNQDRSWLPTGSLPEDLSASTKLPDLDMMFLCLSGKISLSQSSLEHLSGKQGFIWLAVDNPSEIHFLKDQYGSDVVFVSTNSQGEERTYIKPSKLWRGERLQANTSQTINKSNDAQWNVQTDTAQTTYSVETVIGPSIKIAISRNVDVNLVFALEVSGWPAPAEPWICRRRHWPGKGMIQEIVHAGHHVIPKPSHGGNPDTEWRLSFSKAELLLSKAMTQTQKNCYKILKVICTEEFSDPKVICSYHLKTTFLWALERVPATHWSGSRIGQRVLGLLSDLQGCLTSGRLPNYFIPEMNLLEGLSNRDLQLARDQVTRILIHPLIFPTKPWVFLIYNGLGFKFQNDIQDYFLDPINKLDAWKIFAYTLWVHYLIKVRATQQLQLVRKKLEEEPTLAKFIECLTNFTPTDKIGQIKNTGEYLLMDRNQALEHYKSQVGYVNARNFDLVMGSVHFEKNIDAARL